MSAATMPLDANRVVTLRHHGHAVIGNPVRIGDAIRVEGRIAGLRPSDRQVGSVEIACSVPTRSSLKAVGFTSEVLWRRDLLANKGGAR